LTDLERNSIGRASNRWEATMRKNRTLTELPSF
jgi:hypothetical protein